jgi:hypothetical protein
MHTERASFPIEAGAHAGAGARLAGRTNRAAGKNREPKGPVARRGRELTARTSGRKATLEVKCGAGREAGTSHSQICTAVSRRRTERSHARRRQAVARRGLPPPPSSQPAPRAFVRGRRGRAVRRAGSGERAEDQRRRPCASARHDAPPAGQPWATRRPGEANCRRRVHATARASSETVTKLRGWPPRDEEKCDREQRTRSGLDTGQRAESSAIPKPQSRTPQRKGTQAIRPAQREDGVSRCEVGEEERGEATTRRPWPSLKQPRQSADCAGRRERWVGLPG